MVLNAPLNVHWELTNICNLRCVHCYQQDDGPRTGLPAADTLMTIVRRIVRAGVFEVTLTGGEVLLVRELPDIVAYLNDNSIRPHITSNGMLVDDRTADWLAAADVTFQISLDAADPALHNDIRRSPIAFERALAGADRLVSRGVEVSIAYTATPQNLAELPGLVALAAEHGIGRVCVGEVLPEFGTARTRSQLRLDPEPFAAFTAGLAELRERYRGRVDVAVALLSGHAYDPRLRESPCTALARDLAILHDGWAYPCPFVRSPEHRLGNVLLQSIGEIWSGAAAERFRTQKGMRTTKHCVSAGTRPGPVPVSITTRRAPGDGAS